MNPDKIRERIAQLEKEQRSAFANYNALHGAIQEAQYWLSVVERDEQKSKPPDEDGDKTD